MCTDHLTEMTGVGCPPAFLFNNTTLLGLFEIFFQGPQKDRMRRE